MRKLLTILAVLLLCLGCAAMAQAETPNDYIGWWKAETVGIGPLNVKADALDGETFLHIYEDGRVTLNLMGNFTNAEIVQTDGETRLMLANVAYPLVIGADGRMSLVLTVEDVTMTVNLVRGDIDRVAAFQPFVGRWTLNHAALMGITLSKEELDLVCDMTAYEDGYGIMILNGEAMSFYLEERADGVYWVDTENVSDLVTVDAEGRVHFSLTSDGVTLTLVMEPVVLVTPVAPEAPVIAGTAVGFEGSWRATSVKALGMTFTIEEVGISALTLDFTGDTAMLGMNGEAAPCAVTYSGSTCLINDGVTEAPCSLNEDGTLTFQLEAEGITMDIIMVREGDVPAVEAPLAEVTMVECSFCGAEHMESESTAIGGMILCPACNVRFFN